MADIKEYKCPACGGAMEFDSKSQKMKCPFCDTVVDMAEFEEADAGNKAKQNKQEGKDSLTERCSRTVSFRLKRIKSRQKKRIANTSKEGNFCHPSLNSRII